MFELVAVLGSLVTILDRNIFKAVSCSDTCRLDPRVSSKGGGVTPSFPAGGGRRGDGPPPERQEFSVRL